MKHIFLAFVLILSFSGYAQQRSFYGRVLDHRLRGVPFATIQAKDRHEGVYADEHGFFSFSANSDTVKALIVSCMGYETKQVDVADMPKDSIIIALKQKAATLKEVAITADKGDSKEKVLGRKKIKYYGDCYRYYGSETAILLKPESKRKGYLKDIFVFITNEGVYNTKFRVHVYAWDSVTKLPGEELTDSNLILQAGSGNEWVKADVSSKVIPINKGVFISVEWIAGFGNTVESLKSSRHNEVTNYNGQVLGLTMDYGMKALTYSRQPFHKEWEYMDPAERTRQRMSADPGSQQAYRPFSFLNPMIYATFYNVK